MKNRMIEIKVISTIDGASEKNLFYFPENKKNVPLLVGLHTWSFDRFNQVECMFPFCEEHGWALLLPEFRGPNLVSNTRAKEACASVLAKQDVVDAVEYVKKNYSIDAGRVMALGASGGGHMALMMAAYAPKLWKAVSSWVPVTDLTAWHKFNPGYAAHIEACCGGKPGESPEIDKEYMERSPNCLVEKMVETNISIHHGRWDNSVSYADTWKLAMKLESLNPKRFFFEIFDGGHELYYDVAFKWLSKQLAQKDEKAVTG